ncbi:MAG: DinB family protein [Candidatus Dormibacteria bacterium]
MAQEPGPQQLVALLAATPGSIAELTARAPRRVLHSSPTPGEWSANEVLAHLRASSDMWGGAMASIVNEWPSSLRAVNPRTWIDHTDYVELEFPVSLRAFTEQRGKLLAVLDSLSAPEWMRSVTVTGAGAPLQRTVLDYGRRLVRHERPHVKQIGLTVHVLTKR